MMLYTQELVEKLKGCEIPQCRDKGMTNVNGQEQISLSGFFSYVNAQVFSPVVISLPAMV